jgi:hypothetical protein
MTAEGRTPDHLDPGVIAAFIDGALSRADRARAEAHLADCDECRAELVAVSRIVGAPARRRTWYVPAAAAAAAVLLFVLVRQAPETREPTRVTREPAITSTVAPVAITPRGTVHAAAGLVWTSVPYADLYRVTIFDDAGRAVWETQTRDTTISVPPAIHLEPRTSYFWKLEAQTGWNRWVPSELVEFSIDPKGR